MIKIGELIAPAKLYRNGIKNFLFYHNITNLCSKLNYLATQIKNILRHFRKATFWIYERNLLLSIPDLISKEKRICQVKKRKQKNATELPSLCIKKSNLPAFHFHSLIQQHRCFILCQN